MPTNETRDCRTIFSTSTPREISAPARFAAEGEGLGRRLGSSTPQDHESGFGLVLDVGAHGFEGQAPTEPGRGRRSGRRVVDQLACGNTEAVCGKHGLGLALHPARAPRFEGRLQQLGRRFVAGVDAAVSLTYASFRHFPCGLPWARSRLPVQLVYMISH